MPSLRITKFGGINTEIAPRLAPEYTAQVAHNCLLWDGSLRPLAQWSKVLGVAYLAANSIALSEDNSIVITTPLRDAELLKGAMYPPNTIVGLTYQPYGVLDANINYANKFTAKEGMPVGVQRPVVTGTLNYSRQYKSDKPVNRLYAVSAIRVNGNGVEESPLTLVPEQSAQSIIYEGDIAFLNLIVSSPSVPYNGLRLYRTISGMDTAQTPQNEFDTNWHLIADYRLGTSFAYADGGAATNDPLDLYLAERFYPPPVKFFDFFGVLDGGWMAAVASDGTIAISERYLYHAWPTENTFQIIGETLTDAVVQYDNIFIGTRNKPYVAAVSVGEKLGVQCNITDYPEKYECLPGTMDGTPSGAMYTSPSGIVSLTREGMQLVSAGLSNGVLPLYKTAARTEIQNTEDLPQEILGSYPMRFEHTAYGGYFHGAYLGFCRIPTEEKGLITVGEEQVPGTETLYINKGFLFYAGSTLDGDRPISKLTTFDSPIGVRAHTTGGSGFYVLAADGVYKMAFPDTKGNEAYAKANKYCYTWKSKKFVFPGQMCMAAAKVVHDCRGFVRLKIFVDCCCVYETLVESCKPFTLPPNIVGVEYEVELTGTSTVHEVHVASSLRELLEHE